jgi:hypothetical protein
MSKKTGKFECKFQEIGFSIFLYLKWLESAADPKDKRLRNAVKKWQLKLKEYDLNH